MVQNKKTLHTVWKKCKIYAHVSWQIAACTCKYIAAYFHEHSPLFSPFVPSKPLSTNNKAWYPRQDDFPLTITFKKAGKVWHLGTHAAKHTVPSHISSKASTLPFSTFHLDPVNCAAAAKQPHPHPVAWCMVLWTQSFWEILWAWVI